MYTVTISPQEQEDRKRSMRISLFIHTLLLLLLLIPIITPRQLSPNEFQRVITIKFEKDASTMSGSSGSSALSGEPAAAGAEEASSPREKVDINELQSTPQQTSKAFTMPERKQIITAPNPEIALPSADKSVKQPVVFKEIRETEAPEEFEDIPPLKEYIPEEKVVFHSIDPQADLASESASGLFDNTDWADGSGRDSGSGATNEGSGQGTSGSGSTDGGSGEGTGQGTTGAGSGTGTGPGNAGNDSGRGNMGKAMWGDYAGDGLFNRKVLKHSNVGSIAGLEGKFRFKVCLDRSGNVVYSEIDPSASTIQDRQIQANAEKLVGQMIWDADNTAPRIQCGWYTLIYIVEE